MRTESNGGFQQSTAYQIYPKSFLDSTGAASATCEA